MKRNEKAKPEKPTKALEKAKPEKLTKIPKKTNPPSGESASTSPKNNNNSENEGLPADNVIVAIRVRPLNEKELQRGDKKEVKADKDGKSLIVCGITYSFLNSFLPFGFF